MNAVNLAKAGDAQPLKWRLTDTAGQNIYYPASFVGVRSYPVTCGVFPGGPIFPILEDKTTGSSGLRYMGMATGNITGSLLRDMPVPAGMCMSSLAITKNHQLSNSNSNDYSLIEKILLFFEVKPEQSLAVNYP